MKANTLDVKKVKQVNNLWDRMVEVLFQGWIGDIVKIMETRPLSATKRFRLLEVVEEAVII